jgi:protein-tyrosine phosphatase
MLDFHSHLIPGVDDGAATIDESRAGLKAMSASGITGIITTPHLTASQIETRAATGYLERVAEAWGELQQLVADEFPLLKIARGFEVMLDTPRPRLDEALFRLAGTNFVLVEFPFMAIPPNSTFVIREVCGAGWIPVIAHPERYANMEGNLALIPQWREAGAYLQINAGSLLGAYGTRPRRIVWDILAEGHADYLCSDFHSRGRCYVGAATAEMKKRGLSSQLVTMVKNAKNIIRNERPSPVQPAEIVEQPVWKKVLPWT